MPPTVKSVGASSGIPAASRHSSELSMSNGRSIDYAILSFILVISALIALGEGPLRDLYAPLNQFSKYDPTGKTLVDRLSRPVLVKRPELLSLRFLNPHSDGVLNQSSIEWEIDGIWMKSGQTGMIFVELYIDEKLVEIVGNNVTASLVQKLKLAYNMNEISLAIGPHDVVLKVTVFSPSEFESEEQAMKLFGCTTNSCSVLATLAIYYFPSQNNQQTLVSQQQSSQQTDTNTQGDTIVHAVGIKRNNGASSEKTSFKRSAATSIPKDTNSMSTPPDLGLKSSLTPTKDNLNENGLKMLNKENTLNPTNEYQRTEMISQSSQHIHSKESSSNNINKNNNRNNKVADIEGRGEKNILREFSSRSSNQDTDIKNIKIENGAQSGQIPFSFTKHIDISSPLSGSTVTTRDISMDVNLSPETVNRIQELNSAFRLHLVFDDDEAVDITELANSYILNLGSISQEIPVKINVVLGNVERKGVHTVKVELVEVVSSESLYLHAWDVVRVLRM